MEEPLLQARASAVKPEASPQWLLLTACDDEGHVGGPYSLRRDRINGMPVWEHKTMKRLIRSYGDGTWAITIDSDKAQIESKRACFAFSEGHNGRRPDQVADTWHFWNVERHAFDSQRIQVRVLETPLDAIDVFEAGNRIGALKDIALEDNPKLSDYLNDAVVDSELPIRSVFNPPVHYSAIQASQQKHGFNVGDRVLARAGPELLARKYESRLSREWYPAEIVGCNGDGQYKITWDSGDYVDLIKQTADMKHVELTGAGMDGTQLFLHEHGHGRGLTAGQKGLLAVIVSSTFAGISTLP